RLAPRGDRLRERAGRQHALDPRIESRPRDRLTQRIARRRRHGEVLDTDRQFEGLGPGSRLRRAMRAEGERQALRSGDAWVGQASDLRLAEIELEPRE